MHSVPLALDYTVLYILDLTRYSFHSAIGSFNCFQNLSWAFSINDSLRSLISDSLAELKTKHIWPLVGILSKMLWFQMPRFSRVMGESEEIYFFSFLHKFTFVISRLRNVENVKEKFLVSTLISSSSLAFLKTYSRICYLFMRLFSLFVLMI